MTHKCWKNFPHMITKGTDETVTCLYKKGGGVNVCRRGKKIGFYQLLDKLPWSFPLWQQTSSLSCSGKWASSLLEADTDNVNQNTQSDVSITREGTDKINPFMKTRLSTVWIIQCSKKKFSMIHRPIGPHSSYESAQSCTLAAPSGRKMGQHVKTVGKLKTASVVDCKVITDQFHNEPTAFSSVQMLQSVSVVLQVEMDKF